MKPSLRTTLALIFIPLGLALGICGWLEPDDENKAIELLFHGAAICFEIAIGVAIVERLIENAHEREDLRVLAAEILNEIMFFAWVWTGQDLFIRPDKTISALDTVNDADLMAPCTESLALKLARSARRALLIHERLINAKRQKNLYGALSYLSCLSIARNFDNTLDKKLVEKLPFALQSPPPLSEGRLAKYVSLAAIELFSFLKLPYEEQQIFMPDLSIEAQEFRYEGKRRGYREGAEPPSFLRKR